jgi:raffinose/stachyose/melibiose transport system substrate-binding protein
MINHRASVTLAAVVSSTLLTALGVTPALSQTQLLMIAPTSGNGIGLEAAAKDFNASQSDIVVQVDKVPASVGYAQAVMPMLQGGADIDLLFVNTGVGNVESVQNLGSNGYLADLTGTDYAKAWPLSDANYRPLYSDGKMYAVPLALIGAGLIYNNGALEANGLKAPGTFDELLALCDAVAKIPGKRAIGVTGASPQYFMAIVAASTVYLDTPDWDQKKTAGETSFADSAGWRLMTERVQSMLDRKCFPDGVQAYGVPDLAAQIAAENVFLSAGPTSMMGGAKGLNPALDLRMRPFPEATVEATKAIAMVNDSLAVPERSTKKEAAFTFLSWLSQPEQMAKYQKLAGGIPPAMIAVGEFPTDLADFAPFFAAGRVGQVPFNAWPKPQVSETLSQMGAAYMAGSATADQLLTALDEAWDN